MKISKESMIQIYREQPGDYYMRQVRNKGLRSRLLSKRQRIIYDFTKKYYRGGKILDIGCGNSLWNRDNISMVGLDICEAMLEHNSRRMSNFFPVKADISAGLPFKSGSVNIAVVTEVLEHFGSYGGLIAEIRRVLRKDGIAIVSVPYARLPGLWGILFPLWCRYKGWRDKDKYYSNRCGHVVGFDVGRITRAFGKFTPLELKNFNYLTIFCVARKE